MSRFLIDTNVISEFVKPEPSPHVIRWFQSADPDALFASVLTLGEIRIGIEQLPIGKGRANLEQWLDEGLPAWFQSNLLPVTESVVNRWATLTTEARKKGVSLDVADGLIAATASQHDLAIVTRNVKDFEGLGIEIINPWRP